ncbi:MAG: glycosyltransferase family 2 protein [Bacteroidia bacterium]|nr:glycosyltransferase family 2 protein [Bacteroidia bacterium]
MQSLSVVIVCKNEADKISRVLQSLEGLTDDIIIYDTGSTDATLEIVRQHRVSIYKGLWEGFGKTKKIATALAKYDWILSLDGDESIDPELKQSLLSIELNNIKNVYELRFKNFLGNKYLKYGEWGSDKHTRLFNRKTVNWDDAAVHEQLILSKEINLKKLKGYVLHQTAKNIKEYASKMVEYAMLNAEKYYHHGKKASWFKIYMAPGFNFINYYILKLGFLDGHDGYICAKVTAQYTFLKYIRLKELEQQNKKR